MSRDWEGHKDPDPNDDGKIRYEFRVLAALSIVGVIEGVLALWHLLANR